MQIKYNKTIYLILLLVVSTVYYSFFSFSVISPQMGWWQYYAYCLINGDLLYKDVYVYLPPYFPLFTTGLYYLFENNFLYYSIFGFVFIRCVAWSILYLILTRLSTPLYSFVSVFLGICITSSYLMDQPYDYNPAIFTLVILLLYFFIKLNETRNDIYIISSGMIVGILFMTKQTVGIILPLVVCILLYIQYKEDNLKKRYVIS